MYRGTAELRSLVAEGSGAGVSNAGPGWEMNKINLKG